MTVQSADGFFVYGTLKPGELGFGQIKQHVVHAEPAHVVHYGIFLRDGLPAMNDYPGGRTEGFLLFPKNGEEELLLSAIALFEPKHLYRRDRVHVVNSTGQKCEAQTHLAKAPDSGFKELLEPGRWTAARDPLFLHGLPETRRLILQAPRRQGHAIDSSMPDFWRAYVPMLGHFLVLCSILERFITFAYPGKSIGQRLEAFTQAPDARTSAQGLEPPPRTTIYSTDKMDKVTWTPENPWDFWYQVRCNAVHRGKSAEHDLPLVTSCARAMSQALTTVLAGRLPELAREWS
jgi:gamma-glutamylcyclotransferase (GGCT)/AIG2-like uncharacterized protein YtfP